MIRVATGGMPKLQHGGPCVVPGPNGTAVPCERSVYDLYGDLLLSISVSFFPDPKPAPPVEKQAPGSSAAGAGETAAGAARPRNASKVDVGEVAAVLMDVPS